MDFTRRVQGGYLPGMRAGRRAAREHDSQKGDTAGCEPAPETYTHRMLCCLRAEALLPERRANPHESGTSVPRQAPAGTRDRSGGAAEMDVEAAGPSLGGKGSRARSDAAPARKSARRTLMASWIPRRERIT